jgi:hypothetical protein
VGFVGPDHGDGGKYLMLPPGYKSEVPDGYILARPRTFGSWLFFRTFLVDGDPKPGVDLVKKVMKIYPLSQATNPRPLTFVDVSGQYFNTVAPADYSFWEMLNQIVQEEPIESLDEVRLGFYASVGIEKGKPFAPDERMKKILTEAAAVGDASARAITYRTRQKAAYYYEHSGWKRLFVAQRITQNNSQNHISLSL